MPDMAAAAPPRKGGADKKRVSYYYDPDIGNFYYGQVRVVSLCLSVSLSRSGGVCSALAVWVVGGRRARAVLNMSFAAQGHPMKPHRIRVAHHLIVVRCRPRENRGLSLSPRGEVFGRGGGESHACDRLVP